MRCCYVSSRGLDVAPSDPNVWDTVGEAYDVLGEVDVARAYEGAARRIAPSFKDGGEGVWKDNLAEYRRLWEQHGVTTPPPRQGWSEQGP